MSRIGPPYGKCVPSTELNWTRNVYEEMYSVGYSVMVSWNKKANEEEVIKDRLLGLGPVLPLICYLYFTAEGTNMYHISTKRQMIRQISNALSNIQMSKGILLTID